MDITVSSCNDCPFCIKDLDYDSPNNYYVSCGLHDFNNRFKIVPPLVIYCGNNFKKLKTPKNCPLKNNVLTISLNNL